MPRQSTARQQPINSFSSSADSSTSYLSARPKSHSPRSNFNPFSPLSPHPPDKELEGSDDEDDSGAIFNLEDGIRRVYTRLELVTVGEECRKRGFVKPKGMGSLESWYGTVPTHAQDPAIASIGSAPGRRNGGGGFGEGFGYGGGIGGKGLNRGGRNNGPRRNDHDGHGSTHGPLHGPPHGSGSKDISGGAMGKFAVKSTPDKMRMGGDENRKPKDEWRRDNPPHQPQRNDQRHWNSRQEEEATPAWMDDQPDHDPAISQIQEDRAFSPGEDRIAAQKRAMRGEGPERRALVGFFASDTTPAPTPAPVKPVKEYKASNYLLPKTRQQQQVEPESTPTREAAGGSRFARSFGSPAQSEETTSRFFGNPSQHEEPIRSGGRPSPLLALQPTTITTPPAQSPPPPADRTAALMAMLSAGPSSRTPAVSRPPVVSPPPPPPVPAPMFHNQAGFLQMQPPPGYALAQPNLGHDYRSHHYPGQASAPPPQQQIYHGQPPPQLYPPQQQQGYLPPHNPGGQLSHFPPPPPGFAQEQHFYPGGLPPSQLPGHGQFASPQQPRNAEQQQKNMQALLHQWQSQPPR